MGAIPDASHWLLQLSEIAGIRLANPELQVQFIASSLISLGAFVPLLLSFGLVPRLQLDKGTKVVSTIARSPTVMIAVAMAGVSYFGVSAFITLYGFRNGLTIANASLLLTAFMLGSLILEAPLTLLSDFFDRRYILMGSVLLCILCAVFLPISIYVPYQAWILLFCWGGVIGSVYSISLTLIGEQFEGPDLVAANAGWSLMDGAGGAIGVLLIGFSMDVFDSDGLPYIIMLAGIAFFTFALTRYRVE